MLRSKLDLLDDAPKSAACYSDDMDDICLQTLIIARPGSMRDSLLSLVRQLDYLTVSETAVDHIPLLNGDSKTRPDLVIIDANFPLHEAHKMVWSIKQNLPEINCLVLIETIQQERLLMSAGADAAIIMDFSLSQLDETIQKLDGLPDIISKNKQRITIKIDDVPYDHHLTTVEENMHNRSPLDITDSISLTLNAIEWLHNAKNELASNINTHAVEKILQITASLEEAETQSTSQCDSASRLIVNIESQQEFLFNSLDQIGNFLQEAANIHKNEQLAANHLNDLQDKSAELGTIIQAILHIASEYNDHAANAAADAQVAGPQGAAFRIAILEIDRLSKLLKGGLNVLRDVLKEAIQATNSYAWINKSAEPVDKVILLTRLKNNLESGRQIINLKENADQIIQIIEGNGNSQTNQQNIEQIVNWAPELNSMILEFSQSIEQHFLVLQAIYFHSKEIETSQADTKNLIQKLLYTLEKARYTEDLVGHVTQPLDMVAKDQENRTNSLAAACQDMLDLNKQIIHLTGTFNPDFVSPIFKQIQSDLDNLNSDLLISKSTGQTDIESTDKLQKICFAIQDLEPALGFIEHIIIQLQLLAVNCSVEATRSGEYEAVFTTSSAVMRRFGQKLSGDIEQAKGFIRHLNRLISYLEYDQRESQDNTKRSLSNAEDAASLARNLNEQTEPLLQHINEVWEKTLSNHKLHAEIFSSADKVARESDQIAETSVNAVGAFEELKTRIKHLTLILEENLQSQNENATDLLSSLHEEAIRHIHIHGGTLHNADKLDNSHTSFDLQAALEDGFPLFPDEGFDDDTQLPSAVSDKESSAISITTGEEHKSDTDQDHQETYEILKDVVGQVSAVGEKAEAADAAEEAGNAQNDTEESGNHDPAARSILEDVINQLSTTQEMTGSKSVAIGQEEFSQRLQSISEPPKNYQETVQEPLDDKPIAKISLVNEDEWERMLADAAYSLEESDEIIDSSPGESSTLGENPYPEEDSLSEEIDIHEWRRENGSLYDSDA